MFFIVIHNWVFRRHCLSNIVKLIIIFLVGLILIVVGAAILGNLYYSVDTVEKGAVQVIDVSEEHMDNNLLFTRTYSYEDRLVFQYVPRSPEHQLDLYADYELKEDGTTIMSGNNRLYEDISFDNPIVLEVQRDVSFLYELDMYIEDSDGNSVHKSTTRVWPHDRDY